jgi:crossover junction endodeoxyribonuclease RuvC
MFVLGIDPGLSTTGYGVVTDVGGRMRAVTAGVIRTGSARPTSERLLELFRDMQHLVVEHHPDAVAVERLFVNRNLQTASSVGRASGVVLLAAAEQGIEVFEYTPSQVKIAVAGYGSAAKDQVTKMVAAILELGAGTVAAFVAETSVSVVAIPRYSRSASASATTSSSDIV